jgi:hypothetical protein
MNKNKTALIIAGIMSLAALSSCGTSTPTSAAAPDTTTSAQTTEQTTTTAPETITTTAAAETEATTQAADQSDRTDIPESEWAAYQEKIYAANQRAAIFKNHQYLIIETDLNIDAGEYKADFCWFKENVTYYRAPAYEEFSAPDVRFELLGIGSEWSPVATYFLDMIEGGYQYWPVPADQSDWYDPEHETIIETYIKDDKLYVSSVYDEANTENYYNNILQQVEYTGGTLKYSAVFDAQSLEYIESSTYIEKDGKSNRLLTDYYKYDQPVPRYIDSIEGFFERGNVTAAVTVTATSNPGTEKELTKSITIPANSAVDFYTPDIENPAYYTDYECTQPFEGDWDMMSDLTVFIRESEE